MQKNKYIQEAINIGDQLIAKGELDGNGLSWNYVSLKHTGTFTWEKSTGIYSGVCGIVLFFIELYAVTQIETYLIAAKKGITWVEAYEKMHPMQSYGFLDGKIGISYTYLKLYNITKNKAYLHKALAIAQKTEKPYRLNDYFNGIAGTLLVLLHLYQTVQKKWLLSLIEDYTDELIRQAKYTKHGLYWDIIPRQIRPYSGFAHGAAGIGFVFFELGRFFKNPAFTFIAEQAFAFEASYFDSKAKNWLCHFLPVWENNTALRYEKAYTKNDLASFTHSENLTQWCQGAAGIGLAHLEGYKKNTIYIQTINRALQKTHNTQYKTFTLCHGNGGNADLFLEYYRYSRDKKYLKYAQAVADKALQQKKKLGKYLPGIKKRMKYTPEDTSLFMGIAGIGHFLLRVYDPDNVTSILAPTVSSPSQQLLENRLNTIPLFLIKKQLITNRFPRTLKLLDLIASSKIKNYFANDIKTHSHLNSFVAFVKTILLSLPIEEQRKLKKIFLFELYKVKLETKTNNGLLMIKERLLKKKANKIVQLSTEKFMKIKIKTAKEVRLFQIDQQSVIVKATSEGIKELAVNDFCAVILNTFKNESTVQHGCKKVFSFYHVPKAEQQVVKENILTLVKEALTYGLLSTKNLDSR